MSRYKLASFGPSFSEAAQAKLTRALKAVQGIRFVKIVPSRGEFTIDYTGIEPNINVLREACTVAGFQIERKL